MPGPIVNVGSTIICAHGGQVVPTAPSARVLLTGAPAVMQTDVSSVAGCPFSTPGGPMPCVVAQWITGATRVLVEGRPALLQSSSSVCAPNGTPATVIVTQMRVNAT